LQIVAFFIYMNIQKELLKILIVCCCGFSLAAQPGYSKEVEEKIKQVENNLLIGPNEVEGESGISLAERMAYYKVKGLSVAVIDNYKVEWARGYGLADSAEGRKVTAETLFEPGSISKSLNALGILKLAQEKRIDLDADINQYLKTWKFPYDKNSKGKKITVKHLLSHTAGLSVHGFPGYFYGDTLPSINQILDGKKPANTDAVRSLFAPGSKYQYSGGGSMISELILMDVTGQAYDKYIEENVFKPLEMTNTFFTQPPPAERMKQLATGYDRYGNEIKGKHPILLEQAAGGLWTTPTDLCKYIIEMQQSLKGRSNKVLMQEAVKRMMCPVADAGRDSVGLGVFFPKTKSEKYFSHGAGNQGFRGVYFGSLEGGKGAVVFINCEEGNVLSEVIGSIAKVYGWKEFAGSQKRKAIVVPDSVVAKYEGIYKQDEVFASVVKTNEGYRYFTSNKYWKMYFTSDSTFFNREAASDKCFVRDKKGGYILERRMNGKKLKPAQKIELIKLNPGQMMKYEGTYLIDQPLDIKMVDGELYVIFEQNKWKMHFFSEKEFYLDEAGNSVFTFVIKKGKVTGLKQKGEEVRAIKKIK